MDSFSVTIHTYKQLPCPSFYLMRIKLPKALQIHSLTKLDSLGKGKLFTEVYCTEGRNNQNLVSGKESNVR